MTLCISLTKLLVARDNIENDYCSNQSYFVITSPGIEVKSLWKHICSRVLFQGIDKPERATCCCGAFLSTSCGWLNLGRLVTLGDLYASAVFFSAVESYLRPRVLTLCMTFYAVAFPCLLLFLSCVPFCSLICILILFYKSSCVLAACLIALTSN